MYLLSTAKILFEELKSLFTLPELPWNNVLAILMDSASVMRGSKTGLEKRIRDSVTPHLLDIDGDICHHVHNIAKMFTKAFDGYLEKLFQDIFRDFNLSADLLHRLNDICYPLGMSFRVPPNYISTHWLSVYNVCMEFSYLRDAYVIFYYSFVDGSTRKTKVLNNIFKKLKVSPSSQEEIIKLQQVLKKKKFTKKGKERKKRIADVLLFNAKKVPLISSFYEGVLPVCKEFVMCFQSSKPLIHKVYYRQIELLKQFFLFHETECVSKLHYWEEAAKTENL